MRSVVRAKRYKGDVPFGPVFVKHCLAARILGIRPKELVQLDLRRTIHAKGYVYPLADIIEIAARINYSLTPKEQKNT